MLPMVMPGDTLVIERALSDAISVGDIVLFERDRRLCAHRVIEKANGIITRGDAMPQADSPVREHELLGRVSHVIRNEKCIAVNRSSSLAERTIAALARRSKTAARVVVGVHSMRRTSPIQA
jgi:hypothetical protein